MLLTMGSTGTSFFDFIFSKLSEGDYEKYYNFVVVFTVVETIIKLILFILVVRFLIVVPSSCKRKADSLESIEESLVMISEQNKNTKSMNDELQK
ncbi:MAG TPA: hypothetical protein DCW44_05295 [Eubacterium sp.]|nr:hypothetical protein [Eubacterium sp.]